MVFVMVLVSHVKKVVLESMHVAGAIVDALSTVGSGLGIN